MDEKQKKQINEAIELMKSICDNTKNCGVTCPLWRVCCECVFKMGKFD